MSKAFFLGGSILLLVSAEHFLDATVVLLELPTAFPRILTLQGVCLTIGAHTTPELLVLMLQSGECSRGPCLWEALIARPLLHEGRHTLACHLGHYLL